VADRQTDGRTDGRAIAYTRYSIYAVARKKWLKSVYTYGSYCKLKTGVSLFGPPCILPSTPVLSPLPVPAFFFSLSSLPLVLPLFFRPFLSFLSRTGRLNSARDDLGNDVSSPAAGYLTESGDNSNLANLDPMRGIPNDLKDLVLCLYLSLQNGLTAVLFQTSAHP